MSLEQPVEPGDVRQETGEVIERLEREARYLASSNSYGRDVLAPLMRVAADYLEALTSPPAPSGWQQQLKVAFETGMKWSMSWSQEFEQESADRGFERFMLSSAPLPPAPGQNAKDALPPSSSASGDDDVDIDKIADAVRAFNCSSEQERRLLAHVERLRALPVSEASPAKPTIDAEALTNDVWLRLCEMPDGLDSPADRPGVVPITREELSIALHQALDDGRPLTAEEEAFIDAAWEKHAAAKPKSEADASPAKETAAEDWQRERWSRTSSSAEVQE